MTIERAAKALADIWGWKSGAHMGAEKEVRAVLEAIEEPTPEMINAGIKKLSAHAYDEEQVELIWRAMHAELLKRPK